MSPSTTVASPPSAKASTPTGSWRRTVTSSPPASSTSTPTTTPRSSGTRTSPRRRYHGVTTVIAGNCGFSIAPVRPDGIGIIGRTLQHVEDMSLDTLTVGVPWDEFETFGQLPRRRRAAGRRASTTAATWATPPSASTSWATTRRTSGPRPPTSWRPCSRSWPRRWTPEPSASPPRRHRPTTATRAGRCPPGSPTSTSCGPCSSPCATAGKGVVALLPGGVISNDEMFDLQRHVGRPFTWTALLTIAGLPYHEGVIDAHDAARADGVDVWPQVSCRPLVFQMNLEEPFTFNMRPAFAALMGGPGRGAHGRLPRPVVAGRGLRGDVRSGRGPTGPAGRRWRWPSRPAAPTWSTAR